MSAYRTERAPYQQRGTWQWWLWHHKIRLTVLLLLLLRLGWWWWPHIFPQNVTGDYRDPAVLARAIESAAEKAGDGAVLSANCLELTFPDYACSIAFVGGNVATYNVTVASDGSWWHTT